MKINNDLQNYGTILWTNSSPTSNFSSQTITLSSDDWDCLEIIFKGTATGNTRFTTKFYNTGTISYLFRATSTANSSMAVRTVTIASSTSLTFSDCYFNGSVGNNNNVPIYVIGHKTNLF